MEYILGFFVLRDGDEVSILDEFLCWLEDSTAPVTRADDGQWLV
ncbi:hypothetical protein [Nitratireductor sp. ZSWI3]|nr:hypothetical protein [Nitratireductor sp. ZSWI3]MCR4267871.1 hypothetical protein [Nitratireductor sp. ZSWI3]